MGCLQSLMEDLPLRVTAQEDEGDGSVQCGTKSHSLPFPFPPVFSLKEITPAKSSLA